MKLLNAQTKEFEDVPEEQVQPAIAQGTHLFESDTADVPMRAADGTMGLVAAKDFKAAVDSGAQVVPHSEYRAAQLDEKYGGVGGTLAAAGEGAVRGATVGLSDPLAIGAARMFGGDQAAEATRTHLAEEKEAHPIVAGGSEILGAAAPMLATGGAAGAVEAPELAAGAMDVAKAAGLTDRMGQLLRAVGAPARAVGEAGGGAEALASRALDVVMGTPGAEGAVARITRMAAKAGVRGAAEGALFGGGQEISEDALGDHELNAEKLVAAIGHGAMYGGMLGGGLGAAAGTGRELAGAVLNRIAPSIEREANTQMWKALSPLKKFTKEAEARAGGVEAIGNTLRKELDLPDNPLTAGLSVEDLAPKIDDAVSRKWGQMRELMSATGGEVRGGDVVDAVESVIAPLRRKAGFEPIVKSLETYKTSLLDKLAIGTEESEPIAAQRVARSGPEIAEYLKANPDAATQFATTGKLPDDAAFHVKTAEGETPKAIADKPVPITDLMDQRKSLDEIVYKETKALDPELRVEALRDVRAKLADLEIKGFDAAAEKAGQSGVGAELKQLRTDYQHLRIAQDAAEDTSARMVTNRNLSLSDNMWGVGTAVGALASGHPVTALGGIATAYAHKAIRTRGNAMAAVALGRIAKLDLIARASQRVDRELAGAVKTFVQGESKAAPTIRLRHFASAPEADVQDRYKKSEEQQPQTPQAVTPEQVNGVFPQMTAHAPKHASAIAQVVNTGARYLAAQRPKQPGPPPILGKPVRTSDFHASQQLRIRGAVNDPVGTLVRGLEAKKLHGDELAAIRATKPKMLAEVGQMAMAEMAKHPEKDTYEKRLLLSKLTATTLDPTLRAEFIAACQASYSKDLNAGSADATPQPRPTKRIVKGFAESATLATGQVRV